jgi:hypothetical protein
METKETRQIGIYATSIAVVADAGQTLANIVENGQLSTEALVFSLRRVFELCTEVNAYLKDATIREGKEDWAQRADNKLVEIAERTKTALRGIDQNSDIPWIVTQVRHICNLSKDFVDIAYYFRN